MKNPNICLQEAHFNFLVQQKLAFKNILILLDIDLNAC